jgi:predicted nuclease of predicted toxin-antitoxin system
LSVKLLFDENLSPRLGTSVGDIYLGSAHVSAVELTSAPDEAIWDYAAANGFVIVTKDDDFRQHSFLRAFHRRSFGCDLAIVPPISSPRLSAIALPMS